MGNSAVSMHQSNQGGLNGGASMTPGVNGGGMMMGLQSNTAIGGATTSNLIMQTSYQKQGGAPNQQPMMSKLLEPPGMKNPNTSGMMQ